ncbi:hypothetical protein [Catenulispora rubra]|uniref:hypothetical protein n=1 Tax=Catenulispora rubra TaxID=280293 RepID=UPI00189262CF|nr:hypothetical protein [Catenulispora rubra]
MRYSLIIEIAVTEAIATMSEIAHDLFVMACLEIHADPRGQGELTDGTAGAIKLGAWAVGALGLIEYEVDEEAAVITLTSVISMI